MSMPQFVFLVGLRLVLRLNVMEDSCIIKTSNGSDIGSQGGEKDA